MMSSGADFGCDGFGQLPGGQDRGKHLQADIAASKKAEALPTREMLAAWGL